MTTATRRRTPPEHPKDPRTGGDRRPRRGAAAFTWVLLGAAAVGCGATAAGPTEAAKPAGAAGTLSVETRSTASAAPSAASAVAPPEDVLAGALEPDFVESRRQLGLATAAYQKKDLPGFLASSIAAARAAPDSPRALYNLACAQALSGQAGSCAVTLGRLASKKVYFDIAADSDFEKIRDTSEYKSALERLSALKTPVVVSSPAFSLAEKDLVADGIAHDAASGAFFVSSVHRRKIVRVVSGKATDLVKEGEHGLYAVLGLTFDGPRRSLYAVSAAVPEMRGYRPEDKGKAGVFELDPRSGKLKRKVLLAEVDRAHNLNDLVVDSRGEVFLSDPEARVVFSLAPGAKALVPFVDSGLASPQGLALSADEKTLYVADYSRGIARVDRATKAIRYLSAPADGTLTGIDGLTMFEGDLIAVQNGVTPHRVVRLALDAGGAAVMSARILELGHPKHDEPTLGVVSGKDLYYIANSQWGRFEKGGAIWPLEKLHETWVLRLALSP
jgi:sugar lactone lactonase YvrE